LKRPGNNLTRNEGQRPWQSVGSTVQASECAWAVIGEAQRISCAAIGKSVLQGRFLIILRIPIWGLPYGASHSTSSRVSASAHQGLHPSVFFLGGLTFLEVYLPSGVDNEAGADSPLRNGPLSLNSSHTLLHPPYPHPCYLSYHNRAASRESDGRPRFSK
jgi:hypothetical protein